MISNEIDFIADIIDVREMIARYEELEKDNNFAISDSNLAIEFEIILAILEQLKDRGGDENWRANWYPLELIRDSYFLHYVREMLEDCGEIPRDIPYYIAIDWELTAENILVDYSQIDIDGVTYYYR